MTVQELQEFANELIEVGKGSYTVLADEGYSYVTKDSIEVDDKEALPQFPLEEMEREEKRNKKRLIKEEAQKCERHIVQYVEK